MKSSKLKIILFSLLLILAEMGAYKIFSLLKADPDVIASLMTAVAIAFGYVISHELDEMAKRKEKIIETYIELLKGLRLFLNETEIRQDDTKRKAILDRFQDAYFPWSLLISPKGYEKFLKLIGLFQDLLKDQTKLDDYKTAQQVFVNQLRDDLGIKGKIKFETFDIRVTKRDSDT